MSALRTYLETIGWSQRALADRLGIHETRVRRWASGAAETPPAVLAWLDRLAAAHRAHPAPVGYAAASSTSHGSRLHSGTRTVAVRS